MTSAARIALLFISAALSVTNSKAQAKEFISGVYGRQNTFTVLAEYSNDSSHILLGVSPNRKFTALGLQYERRLISRHGIAWIYAAEFRPLIFESDPTASGTGAVVGTVNNAPVNETYTFGPNVVLKCQAGTKVYTGGPGYPVVNTVNTTCAREWSYAQGMSPVGTRINFRTHHRLQPTLGGFGGYIFSTHPIPLSDAGSFNFTFEFDAGFELFRSARRSIRLEYSVQHFSNHFTANENPGVDNGLVKLTYAFGR